MDLWDILAAHIQWLPLPFSFSFNFTIAVLPNGGLQYSTLSAAGHVFAKDHSTVLPESKCLGKSLKSAISVVITYPIGSMYGIYTNIKGVYWWDPWHTIYSSTVRIRHGKSSERNIDLPIEAWKNPKQLVKHQDSPMENPSFFSHGLAPSHSEDPWHLCWWMA